MLFINVLLLLAFLLATTEASLQKPTSVACKDEQGNNVDWWYLYKLPKHFKASEKSIDNSGLGYFFVTSNSYDDWQLSSTKISESNSLTAQTLNPLYADERVLLVAYNDEFPNGTVKGTGGHTKGVVAADETTGIWLIHSVPKFPTIPHYDYPSTGAHYAQSMLCLSLDSTGVDKVGEVLVYNEPHFYYERVPFLLTADGTSGHYPSLERALRGQWRTSAPFHKTLALQTLGGKKFKLFGKSPRAEEELYADVVAPELNVNLLVESWRDGPGNLPASCTFNEKVFNIDELHQPDFNIEFKTTQDHSKWAVSQETGVKLFRWRIGGADWTCVGDINRQRTQLARGGGTVCQKSLRIAQLYRKLVAHTDKCP